MSALVTNQCSQSMHSVSVDRVPECTITPNWHLWDKSRDIQTEPVIPLSIGGIPWEKMMRTDRDSGSQLTGSTGFTWPALAPLARSCLQLFFCALSGRGVVTVEYGVIQGPRAARRGQLRGPTEVRLRRSFTMGQRPLASPHPTSALVC